MLAIFHARKVDAKKKRDLQRGIPLNFSSSGGAYDVTQSELDKMQRNGGRGGGGAAGIMIKVEVQRVTDEDILGDIESDLSGL